MTSNTVAATKPIDPEPATPGYTPGLWAVFHDHPDEETAKSLAFIKPVNPPDTFFCSEIASLFCCVIASEQRANARLIAAAPDLLAALEYAVEQLEAYKTTQVGIHHAAIEKAALPLRRPSPRSPPDLIFNEGDSSNRHRLLNRLGDHPTTENNYALRFRQITSAPRLHLQRTRRRLSGRHEA